MNRVRFNLGRGENFMKWKVENLLDDTIEYFDPEKVILVMHNCILVNNKSGALRIYNGHNKYVVAWIECDSVFEYPPRLGFEKELLLEPENVKEVCYNPRIKPYWTIDGINVDNVNIQTIMTVGKKCYIRPDILEETS